MSYPRIFNDFCFEELLQSVGFEEVHVLFRELYHIHWQVDSNYTLKYYLESGMISYQNRRKLLNSVLSGKENPYSLVILLYLLDKGLFQRFDYFINVLKIVFYKECNIFVVKVIYRHQLKQKQLDSFAQQLSKNSDAKVCYVYKQDDRLLGGVIFRWIHGEVDLSVNKKVKRLQLALQRS